MTCRATYRWLMTLLLATCALIGGPNYAAETTELKAKQIWQLLDYVAVDYGGAVANGAVLKASEYAEMQEFAATGGRASSRATCRHLNLSPAIDPDLRSSFFKAAIRRCNNRRGGSCRSLRQGDVGA